MNARELLNNPEFIRELTLYAKEYGIPIKELLGSMIQETSLQPDAINPDTKAAGFFQWLPSNLKSEYGMTPEQMARLSGLEQIPYMRKWSDKWNLKSYIDPKTGMLPRGALYTSLFAPGLLGKVKDGNVNYYKKGSEAYYKNSNLDLDDNGIIDMNEVTGLADKKYNEGNNLYNLDEKFSQPINNVVENSNTNQQNTSTNTPATIEEINTAYQNYLNESKKIQEEARVKIEEENKRIKLVDYYKQQFTKQQEGQKEGQKSPFENVSNIFNYSSNFPISTPIRRKENNYPTLYK